MDKRRKTVQRFATQQVETVRQFLEEKKNMPPPSPETYTVQGVIRELLPTLLAMKSKGYTYQQIAAMLGEKNFNISAAMLSTYMSRAAKSQTPSGSLGAKMRSGFAIRPDRAL
jgi:hypothetical protein